MRGWIEPNPRVAAGEPDPRRPPRRRPRPGRSGGPHRRPRTSDDLPGSATTPGPPGSRSRFDNGTTADPPAPRDDERGRRPARLRRRRLARRLLRPGRALPPAADRQPRRRPPLPQPGRRHVRGRHRAVPGSAGAARRLRPRRRRGRLDNDGHPDLFVTRWRSYALYRNRGDGTSRTRPDRSGLGGDRDWPTSAAFADLDGDGDLDLYVCHYLAWDTDHPRLCRARLPGIATSPATPGSSRRCPTTSSATTAAGSSTSRRRRGSSTATAGAWASSPPTSTATAGSTSTSPTTCRPTTCSATWAASGSRRSARSRRSPPTPAGGYQAGMGVACGDLDGDGRPDLAVTNFFGESTTFYRNLGGGLFADRTAAVGLAAPSRYLLGFGIAFLDANNDGRLDLLTANGHVSDYRPDIPYAMPVQLLLGGERRPAGRRLDAGRAAVPGPAPGPRPGGGRPRQRRPGRRARRRPGRAPGLPPQPHGRGGHFVTLQPRRDGLEPRRGRVRRSRWTRAAVARSSQRLGGGSYQSAGDPRLHFGLGRLDPRRSRRGALAVGPGRSVRGPGGGRGLSPPRGRSRGEAPEGVGAAWRGDAMIGLAGGLPHAGRRRNAVMVRDSGAVWAQRASTTVHLRARRSCTPGRSSGARAC